MKALAGVLSVLLLGAVLSAQEADVGTPCDKLARLAVPNATITQAQMVRAGAFTPPDAKGDGAAFQDLPAFCRVAATLKPSSDSDIRIEVWMPASDWNGCSAGGRQAMKAAQRFPADFDGIIAGSPGLDWTSRASQAVRVAKELESREDARLLQSHRQLLHGAVVNACDALDGVKDGLIENPARCMFDPGVLECKDSAATGCLTRAQVETVRLIYSSPNNPKTRRTIPGLAPGSELGWTDLGWTTSARDTGLDQFRYIVFSDRGWTIQNFKFDSDIVRAEETDRDTINAPDPNLKPF